MVTTLCTTDVGEGPAVVLVHGHPFDRTLWELQLTPLVDAGFRVLAPDLRGYGESPATPERVDMRDLAGDVVALLDQREIDTAAVVGVSMGGLVAMEISDAHPRRLWAIGLVSTTAQPVTPEEKERRMSLADGIEAKSVEEAVLAMSGLYGPRCPSNVIEFVDAMMRRANPVGAAAALRGRAHRPDYRPWLGKIEVPTFVCVGTADVWSTAEVTKELVGCLRDPEAIVLDDVGHLPNIEAPDEFNAALLGFLNSARNLTTERKQERSSS